MADRNHPRFSFRRGQDSLETGAQDSVDRYGGRNRGQSRDRVRGGGLGRHSGTVNDRLDRDREREAYSGRNGHGVGLSSLIVRADSGGSAGYRGESSYDHNDGGRGQYVSPHCDRDERFGPAGLNTETEGDAIYISNLSENVTEDNLTALLCEAGAVKVDQRTGAPMVSIYTVKETGALEAEVILVDPRSAMGMVKWLDGYEFKGRKIRVSCGPFRQRRLGSYTFDYECDDGHPPSRGDWRGRGRGRGRRWGRGRGRFVDRSPPSFPSLGKNMPPIGRDFNGPGYGPPDRFPPSGESFGRNNPNIAPREGDWICSEPTCGNLNFGRRTHCNNCNKPRREMGSFDMGGVGPAEDMHRPRLPPSFMGGPPLEHGMGRGVGGFGPPAAVWNRARPRNFERDLDHRPPEIEDGFQPGRDMRERSDYHERGGYRDQERFDRPPMNRDFTRGDHGDRYREKRGTDYYDFNDDRHQSPPYRPTWGRDARERSRSPVRAYLDRRQDGRRDERRDHKGIPY
eukprot:c25701_g1_i2 orf=448-1983(-)